MSDVTAFAFPLTGPSTTPGDTDPDNLLATFNVSAQAPSIDSRSGDVILKLRVVSADKYVALPLTEVLGRKLTLKVFGPRATRKHLGIGVDRMSSARERVLERRQDRAWDAELASWIGDDGDDGDGDGGDDG